MKRIGTGRPARRWRNSASYPTALLLATAGGFLDVYTYVCRGGVFANAQTGNCARLAISLVDGNLRAAARYFIPICIFVLGIWAALAIQVRSEHAAAWQRRSLLLQLALLALAGLIPATGWGNLAVCTVISFLCAVQVESFRTFEGSVFASTMCTGNLRSASENLARFFQSREPDRLAKGLRYLGVDGAFILGAAAGKLATEQLDIRAVWLCAAPLLAVLALIRTERLAPQTESEGPRCNQT